MNGANPTRSSRRRRLFWNSVALLITAGLSALPAGAGGVPATVLSTGDGDTLRVREGSRIRTVRLACIDAPETSQPPQGASARADLQALAPVGSALELRIQTSDRYGRSMAELFRGGRNLNQALVASGAAFVYWQDISGCDRNIYSRLETEARLKGKGVWGVSAGALLDRIGRRCTPTLERLGLARSARSPTE